jgi:hypothetical protein
MRSNRTRVSCSLTSCGLAVALTVIPLLPAEHIHLAGIEGRTHSLVHRHSLTRLVRGDCAEIVRANGSHSRALFLRSFYDSVSRFAARVPAVVEAVSIIVPAFASVDSVQPDDGQRAHGPPGPPPPGRAPPALGHLQFR